jgi:predicted nuclease of predicted toxin-antitoxin system
MKILLDANISWKLIGKLSPFFDECAHVDYIGLNVPAVDVDIWNYAKNNGFIIITKDNDFLDLLDIYGFPPKVVLLRTGNNSSKELEEFLINAKQMIEDLENGNFGLLEIIGKK